MFPWEHCSRASVTSLRFKASDFLVVGEVVRKLPMQFAQDEFRISVVVPSQSRHGEQQFRERLEKMASLGCQSELPQSFIPIRVGTSDP
jgi:hypothetical protein